jgi:hypothetical protein
MNLPINHKMNNEKQTIETLAYEQFFTLSDEEIRGANSAELFLHATLGDATTRDDRNFRLYGIVQRYPSDSEWLSDSEFDQAYHNLRADTKNPENIFDGYEWLMSQYSEKH